MSISGANLTLHKGVGNSIGFGSYQLMRSPNTSLLSSSARFKVAVFGHSFASHSSTDDGSTVKFREVAIINHARFFSNLCIEFNEDDNYGTSGETIAQIAARTDDLDNFNGDAVICFLASNSINSSVSADDIIDDFETIKDYIVDTLAKKMIIVCELTRTDSSSAKIDVTKKVNEHYYNAADGVNIAYVDFTDSLVDPVTDKPYSWAVRDTAHLSAAGCSFAGMCLSDCLGGNQTTRRKYISLTGQTAVANGAMTGTTGTKTGTNVTPTGDVADNWTLDWGGDTGTSCSGTKVDGGQKIVITSPSGKSASQLATFSQTNRTTGWTSSTAYKLLADVTPVSSSNVYAFGLRCQVDQTTDYNVYDMWTGTAYTSGNLFDFGAMRRGIFESPVFTPDGTANDLSYYLYLGINGDLGVASANIIIHEIKLVEA